MHGGSVAWSRWLCALQRWIRQQTPSAGTALVPAQAAGGAAPWTGPTLQLALDGGGALQLILGKQHSLQVVEVEGSCRGVRRRRAGGRRLRRRCVAPRPAGQAAAAGVHSGWGLGPQEARVALREGVCALCSAIQGALADPGLHLGLLSGDRQPVGVYVSAHAGAPTACRMGADACRRSERLTLALLLPREPTQQQGRCGFGRDWRQRRRRRARHPGWMGAAPHLGLGLRSACAQP